ncbi:hypothetical protein STIAU_5821 [Stigmatella aurantiaca DW4/3-1]|uniref:Uncharacterized protein n=1 Tax=Stigmatella aurantiaca (strain DW4/3-1) TaxID=378806 RepID=Q098Y7_STIAD|nr:hypothetical protein STIAU_5821 [Stigmatella aurantiaca DW4/3-1]
MTGTNVGDFLPRHFALSCCAHLFKNRENLLLKDAQGLVLLALGVGDDRYLEKCHRSLAHISQTLVDGKLFLLADAQGLVLLATGLEDVGHLPQRHRSLAHVSQALESREHFLLADAQGLVLLATSLEDVGTYPFRQGSPTGILKISIQRTLLFSSHESPIQCSRRHGHIADRPEDVRTLPGTK